LKETNKIFDTKYKYKKMIKVRKEIASFLTITARSDWKEIGSFLKRW
jgi:hypothetical protein